MAYPAAGNRMMATDSQAGASGASKLASIPNSDTFSFSGTTASARDNSNNLPGLSIRAATSAIHLCPTGETTDIRLRHTIPLQKALLFGSIGKRG